jgi:hypothetical protein
MNTANLQLEGLLLALSSLIVRLERKGLLSREEIDEALAEAEANAGHDPRRPAEVSASNVDAICFPIRFLRVAVASPGDAQRSFTEITGRVGATKPGR